MPKNRSSHISIEELPEEQSTPTNIQGALDFLNFWALLDRYDCAKVLPRQWNAYIEIAPVQDELTRAINIRAFLQDRSADTLLDESHLLVVTYRHIMKNVLEYFARQHGYRLAKVNQTRPCLGGHDTYRIKPRHNVRIEVSRNQQKFISPRPSPQSSRPVWEMEPEELSMNAQEDFADYNPPTSPAKERPKKSTSLPRQDSAPYTPRQCITETKRRETSPVKSTAPPIPPMSSVKQSSKNSTARPVQANPPMSSVKQSSQNSTARPIQPNPSPSRIVPREDPNTPPPPFPKTNKRTSGLAPPPVTYDSDVLDISSPKSLSSDAEDVSEGEFLNLLSQNPQFLQSWQAGIGAKDAEWEVPTVAKTMKKPQKTRAVFPQENAKPDWPSWEDAMSTPQTEETPSAAIEECSDDDSVDVVNTPTTTPEDQMSAETQSSPAAKPDDQTAGVH